MNNILEIHHLSKAYDNFLLKDISFNLEPGYIMGLVGGNGAGKTTLINLILNKMGKTSGEVKVFGLDHIQHEKQIKQQLGVIFDEAGIVSEWMLKEVEQAYSLFYKEWNSKTFYNYLEKFHLNPHMKVKDLSRGMTVKMMLATAFAHDAKLLILDEPTSGLDPASRDMLMEILQDYIEDGTKSVVFSTHITSDLEKVADFITCIDQGKLIYTGTKDELLESYRRVKGGPNEYKGYEQWMIGLRKYTAGFESMVKYEDVKKMSEAFIIEPLSIEDILVFISREGKKHGRKY